MLLPELLVESGRPIHRRPVIQMRRIGISIVVILVREVFHVQSILIQIVMHVDVVVREFKLVVVVVGHRRERIHQILVDLASFR